MRKKGQEFLAVAQAIPTQRAVVECRHRHLAVASYVDGPGIPGYRLAPLFYSLAVEEA